jgi:hypothetical protein
MLLLKLAVLLLIVWKNYLSKFFKKFRSFELLSNNRPIFKNLILFIIINTS